MEGIKASKHEDFNVSKFYAYSGPNYYIDRPAMVFNLFIKPDGPKVDYYRSEVLKKFPSLEPEFPSSVVDLFAMLTVKVVKLDMDLFINNFSVISDRDEWTIAVEYLDDFVTKECIYFVSDWLNALTIKDTTFDFEKGFTELQSMFDKTLYGGPTIYSLIEGGVKRNISVHYLFEENQFMWGLGKKQRRGRSTIFSTDGIKDTEFTTFKDMVGDFLEMCGFPTPTAKATYSIEEAIEFSQELGFPVVVKPVDGHKGQGVTTGILTPEEVEKAFTNIVDAREDKAIPACGILVQKQIFGYDHRILTIGGKFAACLKRVPAFVVGDGKNTIRTLIEIENALEIRLDNARSPLAKIKIDQVLLDFLALQKRTIEDVPAEGEEVVLRRVANISAGGVSYNVTKEIHPDNIAMAENIAKYFNVTAMGIDVLAKDIARPWTEGDFGIIEINAGPGVFMHLAPAYGGSVDIPGIIMDFFFGKKPGSDRLPIICSNNISNKLSGLIYEKLREVKKDIEFGSLNNDGIYFNNKFFTCHKKHDKNVAILLRNPKLDFAVINHRQNEIHDYGMWHRGLDMAVLYYAKYAENFVMKRDLLPGGFLVEITVKKEKERAGNDEIQRLKKEVAELKRMLKSDVSGSEISAEENDEKMFPKEIAISQNGKVLRTFTIHKNDDVDKSIFEAIEPYLEGLLNKYE